MERNLNIRVPARLYEDFDRACANNYTNKSAVVKQFMVEYVRKNKKGYEKMTNKIVYWVDEKTGACVELAGTKWDEDLSVEELLTKAREVAEQEGMDLSYGKVVIEIEEES